MSQGSVNEVKIASEEELLGELFRLVAKGYFHEKDFRHVLVQGRDFGLEPHLLGLALFSVRLSYIRKVDYAALMTDDNPVLPELNFDGFIPLLKKEYSCIAEFRSRAAESVSGCLDDVLREFLTESSREGSLARYSVESFVFGTGAAPAKCYGEGKWSRFYMDAPFGIGLVYKGKPNAALCFNIDSQHSLTVVQLQGVNPEYYGHARGLFGIDWNSVLIRLTELWCAQRGFEEVKIISANNATYGEVFSGAAGRRIDNSAASLGYALNARGNWQKPITPIVEA
ncbi:hypothetical protein HYY74_06505 [Candidatus Woesearchaeota archaeon]|nr:hypothetical protein [Candidatus Woesearchaeota archaeon]